jgi:tetratricopeptide (TPR) repeat protein
MLAMLCFTRLSWETMSHPATRLIALLLFAAAPLLLPAAPDDESLADELGDEQARRLAAIAQFEQAIKDLELREGTSDPGVGELSASLAASYEQNGQHAEALEHYRRALYILRINEGLYTLRQVRLVNAIIDNAAQIADWETVADNYDYLLWVYRRNYSSDDPRWLPVVERLRRWHLAAYYLPTGRSLEEHYEAQYQLYYLAKRIEKNRLNNAEPDSER